MNWSTLGDSAIAHINAAITGAGPGVIGIAGTLIGVGVVIAIFMKIKKA